MRIIKFEFENKALGWRLEQMTFNKLNLLVGASGVGKTMILKALIALREIATGSSISGISWSIEFEMLDKSNYIWEGEFENIGIVDGFTKVYDSYPDGQPSIVHEKLFLNEQLIVDRTKDNIFFNGQSTVRLAQQQSIVSLLRAETLIQPVHYGFKKITIANHAESDLIGRKFAIVGSFVEQSLSTYNTLLKIQDSDLLLHVKLILISKVDPQIFASIIERFIHIFPLVEDVKFVPIKTDILMQVKEKDVRGWINMDSISSGMYRTLMQISELYLCPEGTVFLIDEFENSLGINCINEITSEILNSKRQLQFILTSHHPYIIDSIGFKYWKLVTRNGGIVKTHNIDEFNIGNSRHSAFMQLLQLEEYQTGMAQV